MAYFAPEKASEDAINILNRALHQERALSDFEVLRIERNLASVQRAGFMTEYYMASSCFFAITGNISGLLESAENVFKSSHAKNKDKLQVIFALNNAMRYRDIYRFLPYFNEDEYLNEPAFVDCALSAYIINYDFIKVDKIISRLENDIANHSEIATTLALSKALEEFSLKKVNSVVYKNYINSTLDWYSENLLGRARKMLGQSSLNYSFYEDETVDCLSVSIEFRSGNLDDLLDLEDELITYMASSDFPSCVKSSLNIKMNFKEIREDEQLTETVKIYD